jgi:ribosomal protein S18 acetylase RimI-like enzyme
MPVASTMDSRYTFSFLNEQAIPDLYDSFMEAFSDYFVPLQLSREQFDIKLKREGVELTFCAGAYHSGSLVGFILTGLGEWMGKPTAYNAGTGVMPEHRGHRLTQQLYEFMMPKFRASGIEQCLLEVIQENKPALRTYKNVGFRTTRSLDCFRARKQDLIFHEDAPEDITIREAHKPDWLVYKNFCDVIPAWQNTFQAFKRYPEKKMLLEAWDDQHQLVGYVAFIPQTGSVAQLAVQPGRRNHGVATALLKEVVRQTESAALMLVNIDATSQVMLEYLKRRNFTRILGQYEMILPLT